MLTGPNSDLRFPVVALEKLTVAYSDTPDSPNKSQSVCMLFPDVVPDTGDFKRIGDVWSRMERLAESFIFKTKKMKRERKHEALKHILIMGVKMEYVENINALLRG